MASSGEPKLYDLVVVCWVDHTFRGGEYRPKGGFVVWETAGYVARWDKDQVVLAQSLDVDELHECLHIMPQCILDWHPVRVKKARSGP